jgi:hypothetical protein
MTLPSRYQRPRNRLNDTATPQYSTSGNASSKPSDGDAAAAAQTEAEAAAAAAAIAALFEAGPTRDVKLDEWACVSAGWNAPLSKVEALRAAYRQRLRKATLLVKQRRKRRAEQHPLALAASHGPNSVVHQVATTMFWRDPVLGKRYLIPAAPHGVFGPRTVNNAPTTAVAAAASAADDAAEPVSGSGSGSWKPGDKYTYCSFQSVLTETYAALLQTDSRKAR